MPEQMDGGGTLGDSDAPAELGRRWPGPYDYTALVRELSEGQRVCLHLLAMETSPELTMPDVTPERRAIVQAQAIEGLQTRLRNAMRVVTRRRDELREQYEAEAAGRPCELFAHPNGAVAMVTCATHRAIWQEPLRDGEERCAKASAVAISELLTRAGVVQPYVQLADSGSAGAAEAAAQLRPDAER